jgi:predicted O-methyltransferase YrrM
MSYGASLPLGIEQYVMNVSVNEPEVLKALRDETSSNPRAEMQISPDVGQFLQFLVHALGVRRALEVGVFTGYSSTAVALAMPDDGRIIACDINEEWTSMARRYWAQAGVDHKIELRLGPAVETLDALIASGAEGTFDFAFIDADKANYPNYFERALRLLRRGGVIAVDNVLWHGRVIDPSYNDADTLAVRQFNKTVQKDERVFMSMLPIRDGLTLAWKR